MSADECNPNASERDSTRDKRRPNSAVTSGRRLLIGGNPRSAWARCYRDLIASDLGRRSELSEAELSLIRRASALECELEAMEARMSRGDEVNLELFGRLTDRLGRALQRIGLKRRPRDATLTLEQAIALDEAERAAAEAAKAADTEEEGE